MTLSSLNLLRDFSCLRNGESSVDKVNICVYRDGDKSLVSANEGGHLGKQEQADMPPAMGQGFRGMLLQSNRESMHKQR